MKLAVIGSGVSGLVTAHLLGENHEITLFEAESRIGGHINTVRVERPNGSYAVDTGFIVYNADNYPLFSRLLEKMQVATQPTNMSFGVRDDRHGIEYSGRSLDTLFAQRRNLAHWEHWRMLADVQRFMKRSYSQQQEQPERDIADFVRHYHYSSAFVERFLIPLSASLWSCPRETVLEFPIKFVVEFLHHHGMLRLKKRPQWRVVTGGSSRYLEKLRKSTRACIRTSTPVIRLERTPLGVRVHTAQSVEDFDEVVVSCHSDQALRLLQNPTPQEREILGGIRYQPNDVVLHTDTSVLPLSRKAWASWNYRTLVNANAPAAVTYNMNLLQGLDSPETFCVSLNQTSDIAPEKILRRFTYHHPVASLAGETAKRRRAELLRHRQISYCGAYWGYGFHEDGVRSAYEVCEAFATGGTQ